MIAHEDKPEKYTIGTLKFSWPIFLSIYLTYDQVPKERIISIRVAMYSLFTMIIQSTLDKAKEKDQ